MPTVRFGSQAALFTDSSLMSASGGKAVIYELILEGLIATTWFVTAGVCFHQWRTFQLPEKR